MTGQSGSSSTFKKRMLPGDEVMQIINTARLEDTTIRNHVIKHRKDKYPIALVEDTARRFEEYKKQQDVYDYTDMLTMTKNKDLMLPELDYLFIDEAQDLSRISWYLVDQLAGKTGNVIISGDDKQTINLFVGADIQTFLNLPGKVECLEQSYRIPRRVYTQANNVMHKMHNYREEGANWKSRDEEGTVQTISALPFTKMSSEESWLLLARAGYQLDIFKEALLTHTNVEALPFSICGEAPIDMDIFRTIALFKTFEESGQNLEDLVTLKEEDSKARRNEKIKYILMLKKFISCGEDPMQQPWEISKEFRSSLHKPWLQAMDKVPWYIRMYALKLLPLYLEKGDNMFKDAKIKLSTIHQAKGTEADNVVVLMNLPRKVQLEIHAADEGDDTEIKVFYTAITRARKNLYYYYKDRNGITYGIYL